MERYLQSALTTQNTFAIFGDRKSVTEEVIAFFKQTDSELVIFDESYFKIEDALAVRKSLLSKPEGKRVVILSFFHITTEAQNALLKTLEEEHYNTSIIIVTYNKSALLDTLLSRSVCYISTKQEIHFDKEVEKTLLLIAPKRSSSSLVKKFLDAKNSKEEFDREHLYIFLKECLLQSNSYFDAKVIEALELLVLPGTSKKQVTEYILLSI